MSAAHGRKGKSRQAEERASAAAKEKGDESGGKTLIKTNLYRKGTQKGPPRMGRRGMERGVVSERAEFLESYPEKKQSCHFQKRKT